MSKKDGESNYTCFSSQQKEGKLKINNIGYKCVLGMGVGTR